MICKTKNMKRAVTVLIVICFVLSMFAVDVSAVSTPLCKYTYEDDNATGVAVHIKSKSKSFISGKVQVTYFVDGKKIQSRTKNFTCIKNTYLDFFGPDDTDAYNQDNFSYSVKVYNVKKVKKKDAKKKVKTWIKRTNSGDGYSDKITLYVKNTSKKTIRYNAALVMRYAGKDAFGDNRKGDFYTMERRQGKIKPGKTIKVQGVTWDDYKIKSIKYVNAYY